MSLRDEAAGSNGQAPPFSPQVTHLSAMHMAQVLASVVGSILGRLPSDLRQGMFDLLAASALGGAEHVVGSQSEATKQQVRSLTRFYVGVALQRTAAELNLELAADGAFGLNGHAAPAETSVERARAHVATSLAPLVHDGTILDYRITMAEAGSPDRMTVVVTAPRARLMDEVEQKARSALEACSYPLTLDVELP